MFDAKSAKALSPGNHLAISECPGLRLEATQKFRTWTYRYKSPLDGKMKQVKLGQWPAMTFHQAIAAWQEKREAREQGTDLAVLKRQQREQQRQAHEAEQAELRASKILVADVLDHYASHVSTIRKAKGAKEVNWYFSTLCEPLRATPVAAVTRPMAFRFIESHAHTPVQAMKLKGELARAWDFGYEAGLIPDACPNWWRLVYNQKLKSKGKIINGEHQGRKLHRTLSNEELVTLIRWLPNFTEIVDDALRMYIWTGTRGSEIVQMEGREVAVEEGNLWWTIPVQKTKNAHRDGATDHRVPLLGWAREVVERRKAVYGDGYLFPSKLPSAKAPHYQQKALGVAVYWHMPYCQIHPKRDRPRLPVANWAPHDLRRTTRTLLSSIGCPGEVAEAVIGHMTPGVRGVYNKYRYDKERLGWLTKWDKHLTKLLKP